MDKLSYGLGLGIGQQLKQMNIEGLSIEDFTQAIKDVLDGNKLKVDHREAQMTVQSYFQKQEEKLTKEREQKGRAAKEEGEKFLAQNAQKEGVITAEGCDQIPEMNGFSSNPLPRYAVCSSPPACFLGECR